MKHVCIKIFSSSLVAVFLGVGTLLPFQLTGHAQAHAHHDATTHATPLCTLLCSAGQIAQIADPTPALALRYTYNLESLTFISHHAIPVSRLLARGPPAA